METLKFVVVCCVAALAMWLLAVVIAILCVAAQDPAGSGQPDPHFGMVTNAEETA